MNQRPAMRRKERALPHDDAIGVLKAAAYGVLSTTGIHGAYGVPMHHVYKDGHIYMHCAAEGHKLDNIARDSRVCYTVIERDPVINTAKLTTRYRSAIAFGVARVLEGAAAREPLLELCRALAPDMTDAVAAMPDATAALRVIDITVEGVTGKAAPGE